MERRGRSYAITQALYSVGTPPCETCSWRPRCKVELLACTDFAGYVRSNRYRKREIDRQPTTEMYQALFTLDVGVVMPQTLGVPTQNYPPWAQVRRALRMQGEGKSSNQIARALGGKYTASAVRRWTIFVASGYWRPDVELVDRSRHPTIVAEEKRAARIKRHGK